MTEKAYDDIRYSLEYLSKKRVKVPLSSPWPAPDTDEATKGDMCWFLWGALACFYGDNFIATNLALFTWNWECNNGSNTRNSKMKADRMGLLLGIPYMTDTIINSTWTFQEKSIYENFERTAEEMWMQYRSHMKETNRGMEIMNNESPAERMDMFCSYLPRSQPQRQLSYEPQPKKDKAKEHTPPRLRYVENKNNSSLKSSDLIPEFANLGVGFKDRDRY
jgi:hypothetical protein